MFYSLMSLILLMLTLLPYTCLPSALLGLLLLILWKSDWTVPPQEVSLKFSLLPPEWIR